MVFEFSSLENTLSHLLNYHKVTDKSSEASACIKGQKCCSNKLGQVEFLITFDCLMAHSSCKVESAPYLIFISEVHLFAVLVSERYSHFNEPFYSCEILQILYSIVLSPDS